MRDRADEALPCNRPSTLRQAQGPWALRRAQGAPFDKLWDRRGRDRPSAGSGTALQQAQGAPLTVWLIKKTIL